MALAQTREPLYIEPVWGDVVMRLCVRALALALMAYPAAAQDWSGAYIGGFGAYEHANREMSVPSIYKVRATPDRLGWGAGGLVGYNWQMNSFLIGAELDLSWSDDEPRMTFPAMLGTQAIHTYTTFDYLATLRWRAGFTFGGTLVYGTAGVAWMHGRSHLMMTEGVGPNWGPAIATDDANAQHWGWVAGAGLEYQLLPALMLRTEWLHYDFGSEAYNYPTTSILTQGAGVVDAVRAAIVARL